MNIKGVICEKHKRRKIMKKIIAIILALAVTMSLVACGGKTDFEDAKDPDELVETINPEEGVEDEKVEDAEKPAEDKKEETKKPETVKPQEEEKPEAKPQEQKPETKPEVKPEVKPEEKPVETPKTLGTTLLADFKAKAASGMGAQAIAEALLTNPAIKFNGGAMPVEEGYLSGFDNAEIKGFNTGVMFAPMIGSIAFVGYVFELPSAADAPAFIANLEKNANKRWNICVEADEMVTGSSGNKVFFVMCPTSLED